MLPSSISDKIAQSYRDTANPGETRQAVEVESSALPSGAATEAKQDSQIAQIGTVLRDAGGGLNRVAMLIEDDYSLRVQNVISVTAYNLASAALSTTSSMTVDYILSNIQFAFSTTSARDIEVTTSAGAVIYSVSGSTALNIVLEDIDKAFTQDDQITITITQTSGACVVDIVASALVGQVSLAGASEVTVTHPSTTDGEQVTAETVNSTDRALHTMQVTGVSSVNATTTALNNGQTFTGTWEDASNFTTVVCAVKCDQDATLYLDFSPDGVNLDSSLSYTVSNGVNEVHRLVVTRRYFRIRIANNSGSNMTYLRAQTIFGNHNILSSPLNSTIQSDADSIVTRSIIYGETDGGHFLPVPATTEGHMEVAIHGPLNPFGSVHVESLTPIFQADAVYGLNAQLTKETVGGSGSATASDSSFVCSTGTTVFSQATIQSRKRLRYRSGQGSVVRFTGRFTSPVASSYQVIGMGHPEDGYFFGYQGTTFGVLKSARGQREIQTLTITVGSSTAENVTVTLNGTAFAVPVTNSASTLKTAYEIASYAYTGWDAQAVGSTVVFLSQSVGNKAGAFTLAGTTATGTFAETRAGAATTDTFIAQADWNGDPVNGTGPSGVTLDPTKGNVYQIGMQYLGFGSVQFFVMVGPDTTNNPTWVLVHTINNPNSLTATHVSNPSFPFTMAAYSAGSTTNLSVYSGSFAGFVEGPRVLHGGRFSYFNSLTTVGSTNYQALFSIACAETYKGKASQAIINLISVSGAVKHTQPVVYYLIKNGTLAGTPNFSRYATDSVSLFDNSATTVTFSTNDQIIWSGHLGETGEIDHHFTMNGLEEFTLQPGEWVTLAARAVTGTPAYVTGSLNTREDQ